jgi:hypothetical protein
MTPIRGDAAKALAQLCTLGPIESLRRWRSVTQFLSTAVSGSELSDGVSFEFARTDAAMRSILEFVRLECGCCPRLAYTIRPGSAAGTIALDIRSVDDIGALKALYARFLPA